LTRSQPLLADAPLNLNLVARSSSTTSSGLDDIRGRPIRPKRAQFRVFRAKRGRTPCPALKIGEIASFREGGWSHTPPLRAKLTNPWVACLGSRHRLPRWRRHRVAAAMDRLRSTWRRSLRHEGRCLDPVPKGGSEARGRLCLRCRPRRCTIAAAPSFAIFHYPRSVKPSSFMKSIVSAPSSRASAGRSHGSVAECVFYPPPGPQGGKALRYFANWRPTGRRPPMLRARRLSVCRIPAALPVGKNVRQK